MTRMPLTDDVLRGLRWGAILLAGLAIGVALYRLLMESPPKALSEPAHQVPAAPPPAPKVRTVPAADPAVAERPVPSPPAFSGKASR